LIFFDQTYNPIKIAPTYHTHFIQKSVVAAFDRLEATVALVPELLLPFVGLCLPRRMLDNTENSLLLSWKKAEPLLSEDVSSNRSLLKEARSPSFRSDRSQVPFFQQMPWPSSPSPLLLLLLLLPIQLKRHAQLAVAWSAQGDLLLLLRWAAICTIVRQREEMPWHS